VSQDLKKIQDQLRRAAAHACRAVAYLEHAKDVDRAIDHASLYLGYAEDLMKRARAGIVCDPQLREDMLAESPLEPEL